MRDKNTYIYLDKIGDHNLKVSFPVLEDMYKFEIDKNYLLDILDSIGKEELNRLAVGEEIAVSDEDKDCMIILSVKQDFSVWSILLPGRKLRNKN